ncbi:MAG: hypothetical protein U9Q97_10550 [Acidobacteriota bacterium]|nr:hypothetical protein [Acidobacteriota bacterium]
MKNLKNKACLSFILIFLLLGFIPLTGQGFVLKNNVYVAEDEVLDNVMTFGGDILVKGKINESVIAFGGTITIEGEVSEVVLGFGISKTDLFSIGTNKKVFLANHWDRLIEFHYFFWAGYFICLSMFCDHRNSNPDFSYYYRHNHQNIRPRHIVPFLWGQPCKSFWFKTALHTSLCESWLFAGGADKYYPDSRLSVFLCA